MNQQQPTGHICPVCGYDDLDDPAYKGNTTDRLGSLEICSCCDFQFGYDDDAQHITHEQWRQQWIATGMVWDKGRSEPPPGWNPRQQLLKIGVKI